MPGSKPGERRGGRQKGTPNKRSVQTADKVMQVAAVLERELGEEAFIGDAHAFLMSVYKDPNATRAERLDAAGKAIRYEKPALATIDVTSTNEHVIRDVSSEPIAPDAWAEKYATH